MGHVWFSGDVTGKFVDTSRTSRSWTHRGCSSPVHCNFLGSSCCAVQLVLNYFSIGCAGNLSSDFVILDILISHEFLQGFAVLDPYRPFFLGLSAASFGSMLYFNHKNGNPIFSFRNAFSLALVVGLAGLPKVLSWRHFLNVSWFIYFPGSLFIWHTVSLYILSLDIFSSSYWWY